MKYFLSLFILIIGLPSFSKTINGEIKKETRSDINRIYDLQNNTPIEGALIKVPSKQFTTQTESDGSFKLGTRIDAPTIMSVEKSGYKPFSLTLNSKYNNAPISVGIEKTTPNDIIVETDMIHLGDNSYSMNSAHASQFSISSTGAFYSKDFTLNNTKNIDNLLLVIGSIIGIDTIQSQHLGQSKVKTSYSSPPEIFCNGNKIAEIKINGDNQKINIPKGIINENGIVNITIKTGRNIFKTSNIDYDDIEFTNLLLEIK